MNLGFFYKTFFVCNCAGHSHRSPSTKHRRGPGLFRDQRPPAPRRVGGAPARAPSAVGRGAGAGTPPARAVSAVGAVRADHQPGTPVGGGAQGRLQHAPHVHQGVARAGRRPAHHHRQGQQRRQERRPRRRHPPADAARRQGHYADHVYHDRHRGEKIDPNIVPGICFEVRLFIFICS